MTTKAYHPLVQEMDKIRAQRGIALRTWAELAGVNRQTVYRALEDHPSVSFNIIEKLASALNIELVLKIL